MKVERRYTGITNCDGVYIVSFGSGSGGVGTYNLNSTSCSVGSSTITGGEVLGLQYGIDDYNQVCPSNCNAGLPYGSQADGLNWADYDFRHGPRGGSQGVFSLDGYVTEYASSRGNINGLNFRSLCIRRHRLVSAGVGTSGRVSTFTFS